MEKLDKVPVHNLGEERRIGFVNYELHIRGQNFECVSQKLIIMNKSSDMLQKIEKANS